MASAATPGSQELALLATGSVTPEQAQSPYFYSARLRAAEHAPGAATRLKLLREAIATEQKRVAGSFSKNYELARAQYDELAAAMSRAMGEEGANSDVKARMRELESAAETLRSLYNQAVQQFSQMNRVEAQPAITP